MTPFVRGFLRAIRTCMNRLGCGRGWLLCPRGCKASRRSRVDAGRGHPLWAEILKKMRFSYSRGRISALSSRNTQSEQTHVYSNAMHLSAGMS